ncbi:cytochrome P450 [Coniochaeta sp. 2T2.1]|nr:cytochrome P450 [Coniochaeta sp. 2T2.1]
MYGCDALGEMLLSKRSHYVDQGHDQGSYYVDWRKWWVRTVVGQSQIATSTYQFLRRTTPLVELLESDQYTLWLKTSVMGRLTGAGPEESPHGEASSDLAGDLILLQQKKTGWLPQWTGQWLLVSGIAGNSTLVSTSLSFFANLAARPDVQGRIVSELETARLSKPPKFTELLDLPYLDASVKEAMRLYPALFIGLPRTVPAGGATIDGYHVPAGTDVDANPYVVHRNPDVFGADAEEYNPDRWLTDDDERRRLMQQNFLAWGGRSRPCPGQYLAELIIFKLYATLLMNFDPKIEWDVAKEPIASVITTIPGVTATFRPK